MRISLKRANAAAKAVWNDPKWQKQHEAPQEVQTEEVVEYSYDKFTPIIDDEGRVWQRTLNAPPPWSNKPRPHN